MAKPKQVIKATALAQSRIIVHCDAEMVPRIKALDGVVGVDPPTPDNGRCVWIDARYNATEVAAEIEDLV